MVVALARCTRPKLKILFDMALGRRKAAETTPPTFCAFEQVGPEALALVERCVGARRLWGEREAGHHIACGVGFDHCSLPGWWPCLTATLQ
jgi:hypothetical protein